MHVEHGSMTPALITPREAGVRAEDRSLQSAKEKRSLHSSLLCLKHVFILATEEKIGEENVEWKTTFFLIAFRLWNGSCDRNSEGL